MQEQNAFDDDSIYIKILPKIVIGFINYYHYVRLYSNIVLIHISFLEWPQV